MKNNLFRAVGILLSCSLVLMFSSCSFVSHQNSMKHIGEEECKICGLNYFDELASIIKGRATIEEEGVYKINAETDSVDCIINYNLPENIIYCALIYKETNTSRAVFLLTMKPTTGTNYGWALSKDGKMANGIFNAEDVKELVFRPNIESNTFTNEEFLAVNTYYEESISFCTDALYSLLLDNTKNLTISNLGFINYEPNV